MKTTIEHKYKIGITVYHAWIDHLAEPRVTRTEKVEIVAVGIDLHGDIFYWIRKDTGDIPKIAREFELSKFVDKL